MQLSALIFTAAALAGLAVAAPAPLAPRAFGTNTGDGFPNPSADQLSGINKRADGTLSNGGAPTINKTSIPIFQLIAFNENFEVAFFSSLLNNLTSGGYDKELLDLTQNKDKAAIAKQDFAKILDVVLAQEELHAINAAKVLQANNAFVPPPCTYNFPPGGLVDQIAFAATFTPLVLGTLQDASQGLAKNGDNGPVRAVASVIGQEGEQNGFYRTVLGRVPSEKPFLTTSIAPFAFSQLKTTIASCPFDLAQIPIPTFPVLSVQGSGDVAPKDQDLHFSTDLTGCSSAAKYVGKCDGLFVTYFTGQDVPVSEPVKNCKWSGKTLQFDALFPFTEFVMEGLSIASLTTSGKFTNPDDVAGATLAAPGLIQVNDKLPAGTSMY